MQYQIEYDNRIHIDLKKLPKNIASKIISAIDTRLGTNPIRFGKRLRKSLAGLWRMRFGDYRAVYHIKENMVRIVAIRHRKEIYKIAEKRLLN